MKDWPPMLQKFAWQLRCISNVNEARTAQKNLDRAAKKIRGTPCWFPQL